MQKYVVGAMYTNFDGLLYGFDLKEEENMDKSFSI